MYSEIFTNLGPHGMKKQQNILFMMCVASINPMSLTCYQYALNSKIPETKSFSVFSILLFNTFRNQIILQFFCIYLLCTEFEHLLAYWYFHCVHAPSKYVCFGLGIFCNLYFKLMKAFCVIFDRLQYLIHHCM